MGPITGLATIATILLVIMVVGTVVVLGLTVAVRRPRRARDAHRPAPPAGQHPRATTCTPPPPTDARPVRTR